MHHWEMGEAGASLPIEDIQTSRRRLARSSMGKCPGLMLSPPAKEIICKLDAELLCVLGGRAPAHRRHSQT